MTIRRPFVMGLAAAALLSLGLLTWAGCFAGPDGPALLATEVTRGDLEQVVVATGTLEPRQLVSVGAQVSGRLETLAVELGQSVAEGDLIAEIDAQTQTNALRTAQAELAAIEAQRAARKAELARAELAYRRQQQMVAGEATSRADYETAEADLNAARAEVAALDAQIRQAEVSVATAQVNLGYTRISAPMDGVVVSIVTKQGQTVNANQTAPTIVILAQLDVMTVKAEISEADVIRLEPGQPVYFTILGDPDHRYEGSLRQIEPAPESIVTHVDSTSSAASSTDSAIYYNALFEVPNADGRLRALMTAQVSIVLGKRTGVLLIPTTALGERQPDGRYTVDIVGRDGRPEARVVTTGLDNSLMVEVIDGLAEGEQVVLGVAGDAAAAGAAPRRMGRPPV